MLLTLSCLHAPTPDGPWSYGRWDVDAPIEASGRGDGSTPLTNWCIRFIADRVGADLIHVARPMLVAADSRMAGDLGSGETGQPGRIARYEGRGSAWSIVMVDVPHLPGDVVIWPDRQAAS